VLDVARLPVVNKDVLNNPKIGIRSATAGRHRARALQLHHVDAFHFRNRGEPPSELPVPSPTTTPAWMAVASAPIKPAITCVQRRRAPPRRLPVDDEGVAALANIERDAPGSRPSVRQTTVWPARCSMLGDERREDVSERARPIPCDAHGLDPWGDERYHARTRATVPAGRRSARNAYAERSRRRGQRDGDQPHVPGAEATQEAEAAGEVRHGANWCWRCYVAESAASRSRLDPRSMSSGTDAATKREDTTIDVTNVRQTSNRYPADGTASSTSASSRNTIADA